MHILLAATYVIVHGAWGGAWDWQKMEALLTARGHHVRRVQLTGLGERVHLASPDIGLGTHVLDVANTLVWDDLRDVVLVGHSYGGMVITGAADRVPSRVRRLVYVDAFVPENGESFLDLARPEMAEMVRRSTRDGFIVPPWSRNGQVPPPTDTPQPLKTFTDKLLLTDEPALKRIPATYILTVDAGKTTDDFDVFAERARKKGWPVVRMTADHVPERSAPEALVELLVDQPPRGSAVK
jgi:pimeloyl-ACP methyl ester carboxylesterase